MTKSQIWYARSIYLGVVVNLSFAVPALFMPDTLLAVLQFESISNPLWLQNVGMLLVAIVLMLLPFAINPEAMARIAYLPALTRIWATLFWWAMAQEQGGSVYTMFVVDGFVALAQLAAFYFMNKATT